MADHLKLSESVRTTAEVTGIDGFNFRNAWQATVRHLSGGNLIVSAVICLYGAANNITIVGNVSSGLIEHGPKLVEIGEFWPNPTNFGRNRANVVETGPNLFNINQIWSKSAKAGPDMWPKASEI